MSAATSISPAHVAETYAETITVVRVYRLEDGSYDPAEWDDDVPWQVDGYNERTDECSEAVENYATHAVALEAARTFAERNGYDMEARPRRRVAGEPLPWPVWMGFITAEEYDRIPAEHPGDDSPYITG